MALTKFEKLSYVGAPWFFGVVLIICGIYVSNVDPERLHGMLLTVVGLLCMSFYCVCGLLAKIIEKYEE